MSEEQQVQPQLALERIYTKDISFEVPGHKFLLNNGNLNLTSIFLLLLKRLTQLTLKYL
jgi:preprotein translocase subunit SecB